MTLNRISSGVQAEAPLIEHLHLSVLRQSRVERVAPTNITEFEFPIGTTGTLSTTLDPLNDFGFTAEAVHPILRR